MGIMLTAEKSTVLSTPIPSAANNSTVTMIEKG